MPLTIVDLSVAFTRLKYEVIYCVWYKQILRGLLEKKWIACASIFPDVESIYRWEGKVEENMEVKVILKTQDEHFEMIQSYIQAHCSYEVPEIVQVNIGAGNPGYLSWVREETFLKLK